MTERLSLDPTELRPGDVVVALNDHELSGCHCDVVVTVERPVRRYGTASRPDPQTDIVAQQHNANIARRPR